jgi:ubiquinone/menaquinone biosynthesis C-methylase UbiE
MSVAATLDRDRRFARLADTPLGLSPSELRAAMDPFVTRVAPPGDAAWRAEVARKAATTARRLRKRRVLGWLGIGRRGQERIGLEYGQSWTRKGLEPYAMDHRPEGGAAWTYDGETMFATAAAGARARLLLIMRAITWLRPRAVLEVGAGNGVNLMVLACRFPGVRCAGVELTEGGVAVARAAQAEAALPAVLQRFSPEPLLDLQAHRRVDIRQGTAAALPFADAGFDLVYCSLALEQMEQVRAAALAEVARVTAGHALLLEPFVECNDAGLRRAYRLARDHFAGAVRDLPAYGLDPVVVTDDLPGEIWLQPCLVIARKRPAGDAA